MVKATKRPAAQAAYAKKAAALKTASEAKRPQPPWLRQQALAAPTYTPPKPEHINAAHRSQGPPRLLSKSDILAITNVTFPTIWAWMRAGIFPRSRVIGGSSSKSMWLSTEVEDWLAGLPVRPLKGDAATESLAAKASS